MDDYSEIEEESIEQTAVVEYEEERPLNMYSLLKDKANIEEIAEELLSGTLTQYDIKRKDTLDRFLDFVIQKVRTGKHYIISEAYPSKRMEDLSLEKLVIELINEHLFPDIIFKILKYMARNIHDADSNLYLAYLITSDGIIRSLYETFLLFKKDILESDRDKRTLNVKRIQQFPPATEHRFSSPLDAAARFKYVLEFIALKQNVEHIYKKPELVLSDILEK